MSVPRTILDAPTLETTVKQLSEHMPQGKVWEAKVVPETNLQALMFGVAKPFNITQELIETLADELNINTTDFLIEEWETSVGLPSKCTGPISDLDDRRIAVIERFRKIPIVTLAEMQSFVNDKFPNAGIVLKLGRVVFTFEYDFEFTFLGDFNEKFIIVAEIPSQEPFFELEWEIEFTGGVDTTLLRCVLEEVIPANVVLIIEEVSQ